MDENENLSKELVQIARLALAGRRQDVLLYIRRLTTKLRDSHADVSQQLSGLLIESPTRQSPLRGTETAMVPVDQDSRLELARIEHPDGISIDPIWTSYLRSQLEQIIKEREREKDLLQADLAPTRSLLFTGPPGVGKTLAARWLSKKLKTPLVVLDLSAVISSFLGRTGNNLRQVLDYAKSVSCILLLDEFDAIAKRRDDTGEIGELKRLVTVLLQEIDDWPSTGILIAATNHPELLDPAIWRRFDLALEFPLPTEQQVREAVTNYLGIVINQNKKANALVEAVALVMQGTSFSDIERDLTHIKRQAIVNQTPIEQGLIDLIQRKISILKSRERINLAVQLVQNGYQQRYVHEITGVSRDTIRKLSTGAVAGS